jgi:hypothetical protein
MEVNYMSECIFPNRVLCDECPFVLACDSKDKFLSVNFNEELAVSLALDYKTTKDRIKEIDKKKVKI